MKLAIVVSCNEYEDPDIADLQFADQDAADFTATLQASCGFSADEILTFTSRAADGTLRSTRSGTIRELTRNARLAHQSPVLDLVVFFFSGHGAHSSVLGDLLIPVDAAAEDLDQTSIPLDFVIQRLQSFAARKTVVLFDACRASVGGGKAGASNGWSPIELEHLDASGMAVFSACSPGEKSYESAALHNGLFTFTVCEALSAIGKASTVYEVNSYLKNRLPALSAECNLPRQHPYVRVEPLEAMDTVLVAYDVLGAWRATAPIGKEIRPHGAYPPSPVMNAGRLLCALDFGTTLSALAVLDERGDVRIVPSSVGRALVPSTLTFFEGFAYQVGLRVLDPSHGTLGPPIAHIKRRLGTGQLYHVGGRSFSPEFLASLIIRSLVRNAEEWLGRRMDAALVSVPANFSIVQTNALVKACELADLPIERLVAEPFAASTAVVNEAAGWELEADTGHGWLLVIDLGGGTLDVCFLDIGEGVFDIHGVAGDNELGGVDFDQHLYADVLSAFSQQADVSAWLAADPHNSARLLAECERAKIVLGSRESTDIVLDGIEDGSGNTLSLTVPIDRARFAAVTEDLTERIVTCIQRVLAVAATEHANIQRVLLAGQGSKIFSVKQAVDRLLAGTLIIDAYQENAVVRGLCEYTGVLTRRKHSGSLLLLSANQRAIALAITSNEFVDTHPGPARDAVVSRRESDNRQYLMVLPAAVRLPTSRTHKIQIRGGSGEVASLRFVEFSNLRDDAVDLGTIRLNNCQQDVSLELSVDVDANRTIVLLIVHPGERRVYQYQVTNFFGSFAWRISIPTQWAEYELVPLQRLTTSEAASADMAAPTPP